MDALNVEISEAVLRSQSQKYQIWSYIDGGMARISYLRYHATVLEKVGQAWIDMSRLGALSLRVQLGLVYNYGRFIAITYGGVGQM